MTSLLVRGACPHDCPDTCGVITEVRDGRAVGFRGDPDNPITRGWLCAKVRPYLDHVYHPDRLLHPLRRVGPKGRRTVAAHHLGPRPSTRSRPAGGPSSPRTGPRRFFPTATAARSAWSRWPWPAAVSGTAWGPASCSAASAAPPPRWPSKPPSANAGARPTPTCVHSKLVLIWGHNPVSTAPHFMPFLRQAQHAGLPGGGHRSPPHAHRQGADRHLAPLPGSDGALALGMAHVLVAEGLHDEAWLNAHTVGWPHLARTPGGVPAASASPPGPGWRSTTSSSWLGCTAARGRD